MSKEIAIVWPCTFYGVEGWQCEGYCGTTQEEAVMEMCIRDANGDEELAADRYVNILIVEGK